MIPTGNIRHNLLVTLLKARADRVCNFYDLQETYGQHRVNKITALDANTDWHLIEYMFKKFNIPVAHGYLGRGKGKLARWATILMTAKYFVDNKINETIIVLEDDVYVPDDTDWRWEQWKHAKSWVKLSAWGEIIGMNSYAAKQFIMKTFNLSVYDNDDNFVMNHLNLHDCAKFKDSEYELLNATNCGHIKSCGPIIERAPFFQVPLDHNGERDDYTHHDKSVQNKMNDWMKHRDTGEGGVFLYKKLFRNRGDVELSQVINRLYEQEKN